MPDIKRQFLLCLISLLSVIVTAQNVRRNLLLNPGFELYTRCPDDVSFNRINYVPYWNSPTITTPEHYNLCGKYQPCVLPKEGEGYVGIWAVEFIEGQLKCPLVAGREYSFEMFIQPAIPCRGGNTRDMIGVLFLQQKMSDNRRRYPEFPEDLKPQIVTQKGRMLNDTVDWTPIKGTYIAKGGEKFLIIGFFPDDERTTQYLKMKKNGLEWKTAKRVIRDAAVWGGPFYMIDAVSLVALDSLGQPDTTFCVNFELPERDAKDYTDSELDGFDVLPQVQFKKGSNELRKGDEEGLKYLWALYETHPEDIIELAIHTDSLENPMAEEELCRKRSRTLTLVLGSWGVPVQNLRFLFKRSTEPIPEGYKHSLGVGNDRIEYRLIEE